MIAIARQCFLCFLQSVEFEFENLEKSRKVVPLDIFDDRCH